LFTPGAIITFECNEGFFLQGDRRRTCGLDGRWDIPEHGYTECLRESFFPTLSLLPKFIIPFLSKNEHLFFSHAFNDSVIYVLEAIFFGTNSSHPHKYLRVAMKIFFFKIQQHHPKIIYRRGLLHSLHRMDCHSYCRLRNNANDSLPCMRCLSISQETTEEGSKLCPAHSTFTFWLEDDIKRHE
jgi:hypothetical protein